MAKKVLKREITDDEMLDISVSVGKIFPREYDAVLALFSATLLADIFADAEEVEVSKKPKVTSPDGIYHCGNHTFRLHKKANDSFSVDHFDHGVFKGLKHTESQDDALKHILAILANYLVD